MGKSATAKMFAKLGVPVYDADACVHALYDTRGALVEPIRRLFPQAVTNDRVHRAALAELVLHSKEKMKQLEQLVHPVVRKAQIDFCRRAAQQGKEMVVLDIPLLLEKGGQNSVDVVVVVSAPFALQKQRFMARKGASEESFKAITAKQMQDAKKQTMADFVVDSSQGMTHALQQVKDIVKMLAKRKGNAYASLLKRK